MIIFQRYKYYTNIIGAFRRTRFGVPTLSIVKNAVKTNYRHFNPVDAIFFRQMCTQRGECMKRRECHTASKLH